MIDNDPTDPGTISHRGFLLALKDLPTLRSQAKVASGVDLPEAHWNRLPRRTLIQTILNHEFGQEVMEDYMRYVEEYEGMKWEVAQ